MVGIIGKNGAGKSNFLRGIRRALTGVSGNVGNKEDDLRWGAAKGYVKVGFLVGSQPGWVQRNLASAGGKMEFGESKFKTHSEIEAKIYDVIGYSPKILTDYVFVEQGKIEGILFPIQPADRQKSLQHLFGTQQAELVRDYLQTEINTTVPESRSDAIQKTQVKLDEMEPLIQECLKVREAAQRHMLEPDRLEAHKALVARREAQQAALQASAQASAQAAQYEAELAAETNTLEARRKAAVEYADVLTGLEPATHDSHELIERHSRAQAQMAARQEACRQINAAKAILLEAEPASPAVTQETLETVKEGYRQLLNRVETSRRVVEIGQSGACPTCAQALSPQHIQAHSQQLAHVTQEAKNAHGYIARLDAEHNRYRQDSEQYRIRRGHALRSAEHAEALLAVLPTDETVSEAGLRECHETIEFYEQSKQVYQDVSQAIKLSEQRIRQITEGLARVRSAHASISGALGAPVADEVFRAVQADLSGHERASKEFSESNGRLKALHQQRDTLETELKKYRFEELKLGRIKLWRDKVERARGLLHREQLPAVVARVFLDSINRHLAKYLEIFEVPFVARITPDEVLCSFGSKADVPAGRLSGGQKVMLGLAFRFAVYDQFVSSLGILMLDEPTVFLDDDHVDVAVEMLTRIKSYSKSAGLQLIVVTHDQRLARVFDQTIRV